MKVLLVDNLVMPDRGSLAELDVHPHLGLLALAAAAERDGHELRIFDPKRAIRDGELPFDATLYARVADDLLAWRPDAVGFTALGCSFLFAVNVAALIRRRRPDLPILLGGPHATMLHREILDRYGQFDIIVRYEADETFPAVLRQLAGRTFEAVPGISWRSRGGRLHFTDGAPKIEDLDSLQLTSYDHYPVERLGLSLLRIEAGRGCPFNCSFCSTAGFFQRSFRLKSAGRLVEELDRLHARYGYRDFKLDHDMFTVSKRKVREFCEAVKDRGYRWSASARVDCVDEALLATMAEAGCVNLYFGIETGSQRMQAIANKKLDLALVEPILGRADSLGMETTASFIAGFPDETAEDLDATLDMIGRCARRPSCLTQLHLLAPEPGTPLFATAGDTIRYDGVSGPYHSGILSVRDEDEIKASPAIFQTYYHYPSLLPRGRVVRAVQTVDLMRRLGSTAFDYMLRFFDGRLSRLVHALEAHAAANGIAEITPAAFIAFARESFGAGHHLLSLVRFALHAHGGDAAAARTPAAAFDPDLLYVAAPGVTMLDAMHDCEPLLDRIRALPDGATLPDQAESGDETYLIAASAQGALAYRAGPDAAALLALFKTPRTPRDLVERLGICGDPEPRWEPFAELLSLRLLAPAEEIAGDLAPDLVSAAA